MCSIVDHEADMRSMVKENAPVQRLEINLWCTYFSMTWFFNVVAEHPDYFSRIPSLVYNGPARLISTFASVCLVNNLVTLCIPEPEPSVRLPRFSSKLSRMIIGVYRSCKIKHIPNLKSMEVYSFKSRWDTFDDLLPDTLEELKFV